MRHRGAAAGGALTGDNITSVAKNQPNGRDGHGGAEQGRWERVRGWAGQNSGFFVFLAALALVEGLVLLWALRFPVPGCTDEIIDGCFPDWRSYFAVGLLIASLGFMSMGSPPDLTLLVATLTLILIRVIDRGDAYQGFSDPGPVTVAAMFVVAKALDRTGVMARVAAMLLGPVSNVRVATVWMCLVVAAMSAFINNTPIVAAFVPLIEAWSISIGVSPSKLLMPLSFASMLGGMCTLLGTSTNLIVSARYEEDFPGERIGLFDPGKYGVPAVLCGTAYMAIVGGFDRLLPPRAAVQADDKDSKEEDKATWNAGHEVLAARYGGSDTTRVKTTRSRRLSELKNELPGKKKEDIPRMVFAGAIVLAVIVLAATNIVSIDVGALCASVILIATGCIGAEEAYASINGRVMLAIACSFGVSVATDEDHTKVAGIVADGIVAVFEPLGPTGILAAVCVISCVVGSVISNNAAALLLYPIVTDLADTTEGLDRRQAVLVLMVACSASFLTPISFQTNLMVMGPGRYEFLDYLRFGAGLQLTTMLVIICLAHVLNGE
jgi:di/tricarboxylate transporter